MEALRLIASCLVIGMVMMLTVNLDVFKKIISGQDSVNMISKTLLRTKRATSQKPLQVRGQCGGQLYGRTGWFASPNFPSAYPALSQCNWTLSVYPRMVVRFDFVYVDMEEAPVQRRGSCQADYFEIREGPDASSPLVGGQRYCGGTTKFNSVYSSTNKVWVYFNADGDVQGEGIAVRWTATEPPAEQFNCDFESVNGMCIGWKQSQDDEFDWSTNHGPTQSGKTSATGPMNDHTKGDHLGTYAYTEASGRKKGDRAILTTPAIRIRDPAGYCFRFWYNMRGETMGTLNVYKEEIIPDQETREKIFNVTGNFGLKWRKANLNVTTSRNKIKFHFEGVRGSSYKSDMAIDDIKITKGYCPAPIITTTTTTTKRTTTRRPRPTTKRTTKPPTTTTTTPLITRPGEKCPGAHECLGVGNCIEKIWFCDGIKDCLMNDDEENCDDGGVTTTKAPTKTWNAWTTWSSCTESCGAGSKERTRSCDNAIPGSFEGCFGSSLEAMECNTEKCIEWGPWGNWTECSMTCDGGIQNRFRECDGGSPGQPGCIGPGIQINTCNEHNCPKWGIWGPWTRCTATCGEGTKERRRICEGAQIGEEGCTGDDIETKKCSRKELPTCIVKEWSVWGEWSKCTSSCASGYHARKRTCMRDGKEVKGCPGKAVESSFCNTMECPVKACTLIPCKNRGSCRDVTVSGSPDFVCTCRKGFTGKDCSQRATRKCFNGMSTRDSLALPSKQMQSTSCVADDDECMITTIGAWLNGVPVYVDTAQCAKLSVCRALTCEDVKETMGDKYEVSACKIKCCVKDNCNTPATEMPEITSTVTTTTRKTRRPRTRKPRKTTTKAPTASTNTISASSTAKPKKGWTQWGDWGTCSTSCGAGTQSRSRECIGGRPGRRPCRGQRKQKQECNQDECVVVTTVATSASTIKPKPKWGPWTDWTDCSVLCGKGMMTRKRECMFARRGRRGCRGKAIEKKSCEKSCEIEPTQDGVECMKRNMKSARQRGRKCPSECASDSSCEGGLECVCDGFCGRTCQDTSQTCMDILEVPKGTKVSCSAGINVGSKCSFSCDAGYKLIGVADVFCQGSRQWTNQKKLPRCKGSPAARTKAITTTKATTTTKESSTTKSETTCKKKYAVHDSCCGSVSYNSKKSRCCDGRVSTAWPIMSQCCGRKPYNPAKFGCCEGSMFRISNQKCQDGKVVRK